MIYLREGAEAERHNRQKYSLREEAKNKGVHRDIIRLTP